MKHGASSTPEAKKDPFSWCCLLTLLDIPTSYTPYDSVQTHVHMKLQQWCTVSIIITTLTRVSSSPQRHADLNPLARKKYEDDGKNEKLSLVLSLSKYLMQINQKLTVRNVQYKSEKELGQMEQAASFLSWSARMTLQRLVHIFSPSSRIFSSC